MQLERFSQLLISEKPPMAVIDSVVSSAVEPDPEYLHFNIIASGAVVGEAEISITATPDAAVCADCLQELFDPVSQRYLYPFINCTNCGPRYTLIKQLPYDRPYTTMAKFELCEACDTEYRSPTDRRFHAQPNACRECGPQLSFCDSAGRCLPIDDPVAATVQRIQAGEIIAVKGVGGFHLVCDARNSAAVARLRERKQRDDKPFAVLAANIQSLADTVELNDARRQRLSAQDAPVVLCPFRADVELPGIAPGLVWCGVMLPHAPLHYLLFHEAAGKPAGSEWLRQPQEMLLVMTSGNRSGNPLITDNAQALEQLAGIADGFLLHDRDIHIRCDDSVVNGLCDTMPLIRRGRGLSPQVIPLPQSGPSMLACGAFFKNTICLTKGDRAYVSQYIGDLDNPDCCRALHETVNHLQVLLDIKPEVVVSDLHPDFFSSQFARRYSQDHGIQLLKVQHHHAHVAAVMAEHQLAEPVIGLALDGLGLGSDGNLWGGELLKVGPQGFERLGHLSTLPLPGGDKAAREPWRIAAGVLQMLGEAEQIEQRFAALPGVETISLLLRKQINCPQTTSAGRLFDAVAALLNLATVNTYEAQAAMLLESAAYQYIQAHGWPEGPGLIASQVDLSLGIQPLNMLPLLQHLAAVDDPAYGAALFHKQLIGMLTVWVQQACEQQGITKVVLAGGCFLNQLLSYGITEALQQRNIDVFLARQLPCNDGGISLGQAQVAHFMQPSEPNNDDEYCQSGIPETKACV